MIFLRPDFRALSQIFVPSPGPPLPGPPSAGPSPPDRPKFRSFFPLPCFGVLAMFGQYVLAFGGCVLLFCGCCVLYFWACSTFLPSSLPRTALSPYRPPPGPPKFRSTRQPENSKRAHCRATALQTPPKFHEKTSKRRVKERRMWRERKKSAKIWAPHPSKPHPSGPHTSGHHPSRPHPQGPTLRGPTHSHPHNLAKCGLAKFGRKSFEPNAVKSGWPNAVKQDWPNAVMAKFGLAIAVKYGWPDQVWPNEVATSSGPRSLTRLKNFGLTILA